MVNSRFEPVGARRRNSLIGSVVTLLLVSCLAGEVSAQNVVGIYREFYGGTPDSSVSGMTNAAIYPNSPTEVSIMDDLFETQVNYADYYGQRLRAVLVAPATGDYTFYVCSDDQSFLYLSQTESPSAKQLIAAEPGWNPSRDFFSTTRRTGANASGLGLGEPANRSDTAFGTINLTAGQRYYIEVLHKEGGGGDNLALAWTRPDIGFEGPIPAAHFRVAGVTLPLPPVITTHPASTTVTEHTDAQFTTQATSLKALNHQWQENQVNIPGANQATYNIYETPLAKHQKKYRCVVYNDLGTNITTEATLTVTRDQVKPTLANAANEANNRVLVIFSESVDPTTALTTGNYTISGGVTVSGAVFYNGDPRTVALTTSSLVIGNSYTVAVSGVRDTADAPNTILAGSQISFVASDFTPWSIGDSTHSGSVTLQPGGYDLTMTSSGIGGETDQFLFDFQSRTGNFDLSVRVDSVGNSDPWARGGLMARGSLSTNSLFAGVFGTPSISGIIFSSRPSDGTPSVTSGSFPANYPYTWVRLKRVGNLFTGYASYDNATWYEIGSATVVAPSTLFVGMVASSRNPEKSSTTRFRNVANVTGGTVSSVRPRLEPPGPSTRRSGLTITEIMYHPAERPDGLSTEFVEIFNSNPISEDLSGYRLSGDIDYTFPSGTVIPAGGYLLVARNPGEFQTASGFSGALGPYLGNLPNDDGRVRLRHKNGEILVEVNYESKLPWPVAPDGTGASLVLRRPSYGEGEVRAWDASTFKGGSPGAMDGVLLDAWNNVVINEWLAHTDDPQVDFIELYNHSNQPVNIGGAFLSDDPSTNKFQIPANTMLPARGFVAFTQNTLGFALNAGGESLFFVSPDNSRVIDAVRFAGQENGVSEGRYRDGATDVSELVAPTMGAANAAPLIRNIVINELMYHSITDGADEYVELYNKGNSTVDLSGWKFVSGIDFTFPNNTSIAAGGYLVVAKDAWRLQTNYPALNANNLIGNYDGTLANTSDRVAIAMWDTTVSTNLDMTLTTNVIYITVDEVTYVDGDQWGRWADGDGSSLELIDPNSDNRRAANWAGSDETAKAPWVTIEHTGVLDQGQVGNGRSIDELQLFLLGAGECLVDDIEVFRQGSTNLVMNGSFASGVSQWTIQGNQLDSGWNSSEGFGGAGSLHVRAVGGGDNGANRLKIKFNDFPSPGEIVTIRAKARWLAGSTNLLLRLYGNYLEVSGELLPAAAPGTPGLANSRSTANAGAAIWDITHNPVLPAASQDVVVTARAYDPNGLNSLLLKYRLDPGLTLVPVAMLDNGAGGDAIAGDGVFSAMIPGQASGALVAFHVEAFDGLNAMTTFPQDISRHEALVRFGESDPFGNYGTYRFWLTQANVDEWTNRPKLSNYRIDTTVVFGQHRVIYNAGIRYRGSPFLRPGYSSPIFGTPAFVFKVPSEEPYIGFSEFNLDWLEQPGRDPTLQREKLSFWIGKELGVPFSHQRYIFTYLNGVRHGQVYTDSQEPNSGDYISAWFDGKDQGEIYKVDDWFEFNDEPRREFNVNGQLQDFTTTGGTKKQARYRWSWEKKSNGGINDDYSSLFDLVDAMNEPDPVAYEQAVNSLVDVEQWLRVFTVRHIVGDWDGYGYTRGKNMSTYKIPDGKFNMLLWDMDFSLGGGSAGPTASFFDVNDPTIGRFYNHPAFMRLYLQIMKEAANGPLVASNIEPIMDENYRAFQESVVNVTDPSPIKSWVQERRNYMLGQTDGAEAPFEITSSGGDVGQNLFALEGTAPLDVRTITINGVSYPITWLSVNYWQINVPLQPGVNAIVVAGIDKDGQVVPGAGDSINVNFTGVLELVEDSLIINEIMYNPGVSGAGYIEILNSASFTAFDVTGFRLNGVDFTFPSGSVIEPGEYVQIVENLSVFAPRYGYAISVAGQYTGKFDKGGETISLIKPGATPALDVVIDSVRYNDDLPWPLIADGLGSSLQLKDALRDNNRVGNWAAGSLLPETNEVELVSMTNIWRYEQSGTDLGATWKNVDYSDSGWPQGRGLLYNETSELPAPKNTLLTLGTTTYYFRTTFTNSLNNPNVSLLLSLIVDDGAVVYLNGNLLHSIGVPANPVYGTTAERSIGNAVLEGPFELSGDDLLPGENVLAVEVHQVSSGSTDVVFGLELQAREVIFGPFTPGAPNFTLASLPEFPLVWINEIQPNNVTGATDNAGDRDPWLELYNSGSTTVDLAGLYLSDNYTNLTRWAFPADASIGAGQWMVVWLDGEPGEKVVGQYHTGFRIASGGAGGVALSRMVNGKPIVLDYLNYQNASADRAFGLFPDGDQFEWAGFYFPTPGAANNNSFPIVNVLVNEWMANNKSTVANPLDGQFDDWFELYNAGGTTVDLSGYFLSDTLANPAKWTIPQGTTIPANGFLIVWADNNGTTNTAHLHTNFKLNDLGEAIGLYAPDQSVVDVLSFGAQAPDLSQGRYADGADAPYLFLTQATPGAPNIYNPPTFLPDGVDRQPNGWTTIQFTTEVSRAYRIYYKNELNDTAWTLLGQVVGTGSAKTVQDQTSEAAPNRFYIIELLP